MLIFISSLVKFIFERSLSGKESQFLSEVIFAVTFGIYLLQPGYILKDNKLVPFPGNESENLPWEERQSFKDQEKISVGKQEFLSVEKVVYFPWRFHCKTFSNLKESFWI